MSWLYERRDQLDGLRPFVEIAYRLTYGIPLFDRDDVEQDIVVALMRVTSRRGTTDRKYLWGVGRKEVKKYWCRKCYQGRKFRPLSEDDLCDDSDTRRLDALATLATLPKRLVEIGHKRLNGEKLNVADQGYWIRHCGHKGRNGGSYLSDYEKRRIERFHGDGLSVHTIAKAMGRSETTVRVYLFNAGLRGIQEAPPQLLKPRRGTGKEKICPAYAGMP